MAQTIEDIPVDNTAWVDLNTESGISVGTKMLITNKSDTWGLLYEGAVAPSIDSVDGVLITNLNKSYATAIILAGSLKIWAIAKKEGVGLKLSVQEV